MTTKQQKEQKGAIFKLTPIMGNVDSTTVITQEKTCNSKYLIIGKGSCPDDVESSQFYCVDSEGKSVISHKHVRVYIDCWHQAFIAFSVQ